MVKKVLKKEPMESMERRYDEASLDCAVIALHCHGPFTATKVNCTVD